MFYTTVDMPSAPRSIQRRMTFATLDRLVLGDIPGLNEGGIETDVVVKAARRLGFDGVIFRDVQDSPTADQGYTRVVSDVFAVFYAEQIRMTMAPIDAKNLAAAIDARRLVNELNSGPKRVTGPET